MKKTIFPLLTVAMACVLLLSSCGSKNAGSSNVANYSKEDILAMIEMVDVDGGSFEMGATGDLAANADNDELPVHKVAVKSFKISKFEVTQKLWKAVLGPDWYFSSEGDDRPADNVSWYDVQWFLSELNEITGMSFRLPTEAEWEFAAKGGVKSKHYKYSGSNDVSSVAWYDGNSDGKTHVVGAKSPNELGLYDMSGNVWEWCEDEWYFYDGTEIYDYYYYEPDRIRRGGSYMEEPKGVRVSYRWNLFPSYQFNNVGLRLAL